MKQKDTNTRRPEHEQGRASGKLWLDYEMVERSRTVYRKLSRVRDVILCAAALPVLLPILLLIALAVWIDSPRVSPLFIQERVGKNGTLFRIYKFRTMVPDAEARLEKLLSQNEMSDPVFKIRDDPRITRVGRILRKSGIDELPQIINILRGDMSIVGPRPALPREVAQYGDYERQRLCILPGLTCYWQIQPERNALTFADWMELDMKYIREQSLLTDWKIILSTFRAVVSMQGE